MRPRIASSKEEIEKLIEAFDPIFYQDFGIPSAVSLYNFAKERKINPERDMTTPYESKCEQFSMAFNE